MEYERRHKEKFPVLAICYDFDKLYRLTICRRRDIFSPLAITSMNFGKNPMIWQRTMTWILIWRICIR